LWTDHHGSLTGRMIENRELNLPCVE